MFYDQHLIQNALWIVMDPWLVQTTLGKQDEHTKQQDLINEYFAELIDCRLADVRHKAISLPKYRKRDDVNAISPYFRSYKRLHTPNSIIDYCNENNIDSIVYTGFHAGKCILSNPTGCIIMKELGFKTYIAVDLTCALKSIKNGKYLFDHSIAKSIEHCELI